MARKVMLVVDPKLVLSSVRSIQKACDKITCKESACKSSLGMHITGCQ